MKNSEHRSRRLRLHGADAFERVSPGAAVLRSAVQAGAQGALRAECRPREGVRGELGLRVDRDRLAEARRAEGHRPHRHREHQRHPPRHRDCGRQGRQDGDVREAARPQRRGGEGDGRGGRGRRGAEHGLVQLPARAGGRPAQAPDRRGKVRTGSSTTARSSSRTGRSPRICRRAAKACGGSTSRSRAAASPAISSPTASIPRSG